MLTIFPFKGVLSQNRFQDQTECFYIYQVRTSLGEYSALIATISIESIRDKVVLPHEETYESRKDSLHKTFSTDSTQHNPILLITDDESFREKKQQLFSERENISGDEDLLGCTHLLSRSCFSNANIILKSTLCVADGHHRIEALLRYHQKKRNCSKSATVMVAILNVENVNNRAKGVIISPNEDIQNAYFCIKTPQIFQKLQIYFDIKETSVAITPISSIDFCMYYLGKWYQLRLKSCFFDMEIDGLLGIEIFRKFILNKIFNINKYTQQKSVKMYFNDCNITMISNYIKKDEDLFGFVVAADPSDKIIKASREGRILEPNSTYFEPKFINGMISHLL